MSSCDESLPNQFGSFEPVLTVSVAMCTYNGARFIEEQMRSICRQSFMPMEIVLSDDGSQDGCVEKAEVAWQLCSQEMEVPQIRLRILRNARPLGVRANFAQAVAQCAGDVVALCDQDDIWYPQKLERIVAAFEQSLDVGLVFSDADLIDDGGASRERQLFDALLVTTEERSLVENGQAHEVFARRNLVTGAACAFRRSLLGFALPFPEGWVHDEWLALVASLVSKVQMLPDCTMAYRLHQNNTIGLPLPSFRWRLATVFQAIFSPVAERQSERARRLHQAGDDAACWNIASEKLLVLRNAERHAMFRASLPANPFRRLTRVMAEQKSGGYRRWSSGRSSVLHDILLGR